jgi:hypothetical protein
MIVDRQRGARCTTCRFFIGPDRCGNSLFTEAGWRATKWGPAKPAGSDIIPHNPDAYCSDWYEPRAENHRSAEDAKNLPDQLKEDCIGIHTHTPVVQETGGAREYIAVDARGRTIWGPGRDYTEAKRHAQQSGGVVKWVHDGAEEDVFGRSIRWTFDGNIYQGTGRKGDYLIVPARGPTFLVYAVTVDAHGGINKAEMGGFANHVQAMEFADKYDLGEVDWEPVPSTRRERTKPPVAAAVEAREADTVPVIYEPASEPAAAKDCLPWVRVTRDPERYESCLAKARKIGSVDNARKVYDLLYPALSKEDQEVLMVVLLDIRRQLRGVSEVHRGQRSRVGVGVTDVMRIVIASGAEAFVVCHGHPSGNSRPSDADVALTKSIEQACHPFGKDLTFLGHVVIGTKEFSEISPAGKVSKAYKM